MTKYPSCWNSISLCLMLQISCVNFTQVHSQTSRVDCLWLTYHLQNSPDMHESHGCRMLSLEVWSLWTFPGNSLPAGMDGAIASFPTSILAFAFVQHTWTWAIFSHLVQSSCRTVSTAFCNVACLYGISVCTDTEMHCWSSFYRKRSTTRPMNLCMNVM